MDLSVLLFALVMLLSGTSVQYVWVFIVLVILTAVILHL